MHMTKLLEQAFAEAAKLTPQEQDAFAQWILDELDERRRDEAFAKSTHSREKLADVAVTKYRTRRLSDADFF
jgi:hypothetical protein